MFERVWATLEPRLSVPDFVSQLWSFKSVRQNPAKSEFEAKSGHETSCNLTMRVIFTSSWNEASVPTLTALFPTYSFDCFQYKCFISRPACILQLVLGYIASFPDWNWKLETIMVTNHTPITGA